MQFNTVYACIIYVSMKYSRWLWGRKGLWGLDCGRLCLPSFRGGGTVSVFVQQYILALFYFFCWCGMALGVMQRGGKTAGFVIRGRGTKARRESLTGGARHAKVYVWVIDMKGTNERRDGSFIRSVCVGLEKKCEVNLQSQNAKENINFVCS